MLKATFKIGFDSCATWEGGGIKNKNKKNQQLQQQLFRYIGYLRTKL